MMATQKHDHEMKIIGAIKSLGDNPGHSIRHAPQIHGIPRSTLNDQHSGKTAERTNAHPADQLLSTEEEKVLLGWIEDWDDRGLPPRRRHVLGMVASLLRDRGSPGQIGKHWLDRFLGRHPEVKAKVGKTID